MRPFVESLRRLYADGRLSKEKLDGFLAAGKISQEEYDYIASAASEVTEADKDAALRKFGVEV